MSKKSKVILIIAISVIAVVTIAVIAVFIGSYFTIDKDSSAILDTGEKSIADYSRYEDENEKPDEVIVHDVDAERSATSDVILPEDFSFKIAWGIDYASYYNSKTGKMICDIHEDEIDKYTKYVLLSDYELKQLYKLLFINAKITKYPENYSQDSYIIFPHKSLKITVFANGEEKTVDIENFTGISDRSNGLVKSLDSIIEFITSTKEWQEFPDTTIGYM